MDPSNAGFALVGIALGFALKYLLQSPKETVAELKARIQALETEFRTHKDWVLGNVPTNGKLDRVVDELKSICTELRQSIHELASRRG